jgi:hypothetical protein
MAVVPINIVGASSKHRSEQLNGQRTLNMWPEYNEEAREVISLQPTAGTVAFSDGSSSDRGLGVHNSELYQVYGTDLQLVSGAGVRTTLATIAGTGRCTLRSDGNELVIVSNDGVAYSWDGSTLSTGTTNFDSPTSCAIINSQFIYPAQGAKFWMADPDTPLTINGLNFANADSNPDDLVRPYDFSDRVYMMGTETIEPWYNSGTGNPPLDPIQGGAIPVGLGAKFSVSNNDNFMYFLGDDNTVYRLVGSNAQRISDISLANEIESYTDTSDAIGFCYTIQNQNFYQLTFPTADKTWCFHEPTGKWFEMSTGLSDGRHLANSYAYCYGKHLVADYRDGSIKEWSLSAYDDDGDTIVRERITSVIDAGYLGRQFMGREFEMSWFRLLTEVGVGLATGQGSDPKVMLTFSDDRGKTWSSEIWSDIGGMPSGAMGEYMTEVRWDGGLGSAYHRLIKVRFTDPVFFSVHRADADIGVLMG